MRILKEISSKYRYYKKIYFVKYHDFKSETSDRVSNCCKSDMRFVYDDYDSNYQCKKCGRQSYFIQKFNLDKVVKRLFT